MSEPDGLLVTGADPSRLRVCVLGNRGRGVVAARMFLAGETVEVCPVSLLPAKRAEMLDQTELTAYYYWWPGHQNIALALGLGSLYNHSFSPNMACEAVGAERVLVFRTLRRVEAGEELTHDYGWDLQDPLTPDWYREGSATRGIRR